MTGEIQILTPEQEAEQAAEEAKKNQDPMKMIAETLGEMKSLLTSLKEDPKKKAPEGSPSPEDLLREFEAMAAKEGREKRSSGQQLTEEDINNMSNTQLVGLIQEQNQTGQNQIMERLEFVRVQGEIRDLKREYKDFDTYKDEVFKIAFNKPSLSLEEAYHQAKGKKAATTERETEAETAKREKEEVDKEKKEKAAAEAARRVGRSGGERPGIGSGSVKVVKGLPSEEAAAKAVEEALG